jgi:hypothetical protein
MAGGSGDDDLPELDSLAMLAPVVTRRPGTFVARLAPALLCEAEQRDPRSGREEDDDSWRS